MAVRLLRSEMAEPWALEWLAGQVHLSRSKLLRLFDARVGASPMALLRRVRVQRMAELLRFSELPVAAAARAVRWSDANYATRCFHPFYGVSPVGFRRQPSSARREAC